MKTKTMVILSGGQDSTICLYWAKKRFDEVHAITFDYGQRHSREIKSAITIAKMAECASHEIVDLKGLLKSRSPLVDKNSKLEEYDDYESMNKIIGDRVELTFVPMRNSLFFVIAANRALEKDCYSLVSGVCEADDENYPDCTALYIDQQQAAINKALGIENFDIYTPLIYLNKEASIKLAVTVGALGALAYSHTCYAGEVPPCGKCHSCVLRANGFKNAGITDPLLERFK